jgi:hypothetical protein
MAITKIIQRFYLILFSHLEKQKRAWKKLNPDYITAEKAEKAEIKCDCASSFRFFLVSVVRPLM